MYTVNTNVRTKHVAPILRSVIIIIHRYITTHYNAPTGNRLHVEIGGLFADNMDLLTLTRWRLTCKANYDQSTASLRRSLTSMLAVFMPKPVAILSHITQYRAVLGGEFALAFLLRDGSLLPTYVDIYSSEFDFGPLCSAILADPSISAVTTNHEYTDVGVVDALRTLITRTLVINTNRGTMIRIHRSYTTSAIAPLTHASSTALSNFVTEYGFGCSHPILTLNRRALIGDQELPYLPIADPEVHDRLMEHNFSIAFSPTAWPEFRRASSSHVTRNVTEASPHNPGRDGNDSDQSSRSPGAAMEGASNSSDVHRVDVAYMRDLFGIGDGAIDAARDLSSVAEPSISDTLDGLDVQGSAVFDALRALGVDEAVIADTFNALGMDGTAVLDTVDRPGADGAGSVDLRDVLRVVRGTVADMAHTPPVVGEFSAHTDDALRIKGLATADGQNPTLLPGGTIKGTSHALRIAGGTAEGTHAALRVEAPVPKNALDVEGIERAAVVRALHSQGFGEAALEGRTPDSAFSLEETAIAYVLKVCRVEKAAVVDNRDALVLERTATIDTLDLLPGDEEPANADTYTNPRIEGQAFADTHTSVVDVSYVLLIHFAFIQGYNLIYVTFIHSFADAVGMHLTELYVLSSKTDMILSLHVTPIQPTRITLPSRPPSSDLVAKTCHRTPLSSATVLRSTTLMGRSTSIAESIFTSVPTNLFARAWKLLFVSIPRHTFRGHCMSASFQTTLLTIAATVLETRSIPWNPRHPMEIEIAKLPFTILSTSMSIPSHTTLIVLPSVLSRHISRCLFDKMTLRPTSGSIWILKSPQISTSLH